MDLTRHVRRLNRDLLKLLAKAPASHGVANGFVEDLCNLRAQSGHLVFDFARLDQAHQLTLPQWVREYVEEDGSLCAIGLMNRIELMSPSEHERLERDVYPELQKNLMDMGEF